MIRQQLPAYSPLSLDRIVGAGARATLRPEAAGADLTNLLLARYGASEGLLVSSGTHALQIALSLAWSTPPWKGRPVALPAYTCYDVATAAVGAGVSALFYDVDPASLCPDEASLRDALARGAGTVIANSLYGFPLDWDWLSRECRAAGALLVEDSAQGMGSSWHGSIGGSFGDLTTFSFGRGKGWTGGGGGALLVRPPVLAGVGSSLDSIRQGLRPAPPGAGLRSMGLLVAQWGFGRPSLFGIPSSVPTLGLGETRYREPTSPGAMPAFCAAAALGHDALATREAEARRRCASAWYERLASEGRSEGIRIPRPLEGGESGYLRFPLLHPAGANSILDTRARSLGMAAPYPAPLTTLPPVQPLIPSGARRRFAGAAELSDRLVTLPTHSRVAPSDVPRILRVVTDR